MIIKEKIIVENNIFIGSHSVILEGLKIKKNSMIAAKTVLRGETILEFLLAISNPAKIKKDYYK